MKSIQQSLFDQPRENANKRKYGRSNGRNSHGGEKTKGKRKEERPLSKSRPIHLILKSNKASGKFSFLAPSNKVWIEKLMRVKAKKFFVRIEDFVNMGNHIHLRIRIQNRECFQKFLKSIVNLIARKITGAKKGNKFGRFWDGLAYTRILRSSFEQIQLRGYFRANRIERTMGKRNREDFLICFNRKLKKLRNGEIAFSAIFSTA